MAKTTSSVNYLTGRRPLVGDPIESVVYDPDNRPTSITYNLGQNGTTKETVTLSYSPDGFITFKGVEYRNYQLNMWEATLLPINFETSPSINLIQLNNQSVEESVPPGTLVGELTSVGGTAPFTYTVLTVDDGNKFQIGGVTGEELQTLGNPIFDEGPYSITIRSTDSKNKTFDQQFDITVTAATYTSTLSTQFDGITEYMSGASDPVFHSADRSVFVWIKSGVPVSDEVLASKFEGNIGEWKIIARAGGRVAMQIKNGADAKQYELPTGRLDNNWHQVGFTYVESTDTFKIFSDGAEITPIITRDDAMASGIDQDTSPVIMGCDLNNSALPRDFYSGLLDEPNVWNIELDSSEISELYNSGSPFNLRTHSAYANLVGWWRMGEIDDSTTVFDNTSNGTDLTLVNMDASNYVGDVP